MIKKYLAIFIVASIYFSSVKFSYGGIRWVCLKAEVCQVGVCSNGNGHTSKLTVYTPEDNRETDVPPSNTNLEVYECLQTPEKGEICTMGKTGDSALADLAPYEYKFEGLNSNDGKTVIYRPTVDQNNTVDDYKQVQMTTNRTFSIANSQTTPWMEWQSSTRSGMEKKWKATFEENDQTKNFGRGGVQEGRMVPNAGGEDCAGIAWDPDGIVFDSKSLEPIPEATVNIYKRTEGSSTYTPVTMANTAPPGSLSGDPSFRNPYITETNGGFKFNVRAYEDEPHYIYKLEVAKTGYNFSPSPTPPVKPHNNAYQIYPTIYPLKSGSEIIEHKGTTEHRGIPIEPVDGIGKNYPLMRIGYAQFKDLSTGEDVINVEYSHPFTKVIPYTLAIVDQLKPYRYLSPVYSDNKGKVEVRVKLNTDEVIGGLQEEKIDLTGSLPSQSQTLLQKFLSLIKTKLINSIKVNAQLGTIKTLKLEPIPSYLNGYAYNSSGAIIPNAIVSVYLKSPYKLYCQTKADGKGYYGIGTNCLPPVPYTIVYTASLLGGNQVKVSTTQFIAQNNQYLATNKVNLNAVVDSRGQPIKIITSSPSSKKILPPISSGPAANQSGSYVSKSNNPQNNFIFIIIVLLVLILGVLAIVGVYLYKKNKQPSSF